MSLKAFTSLPIRERKGSLREHKEKICWLNSSDRKVRMLGGESMLLTAQSVNREVKDENCAANYRLPLGEKEQK